jgi:ectoine hydroxylase-related dioxygenase (phytanoyl-CoA dioxygenase family)
MARLSDAEAEQYRQQGYVVPAFRLDPASVRRMQEALDELIAANPGVRPEKLVSAHIEGRNDEGVSGSQAFLDLAMNPDIVDLVAQVIGPDVVLWGCHVFCKPAQEGYETPWHQDGHYWPIRPLANCTVWVALEPSTRANGCLRVIPGSHAAKQLHPHLHEDRTDLTLNQRMADGSFDENDAVDIELEPGQMSMHDIYMIHGAQANRSGIRRTGVALRYMPGSSLFDRSLKPSDGQTGVPVSFATRPLWLLRGEDRPQRLHGRPSWPLAGGLVPSPVPSHRFLPHCRWRWRTAAAPIPPCCCTPVRASGRGR